MASISELQQGLIETYMITSACALFLYESTITLGREVDVVWGRRWTAITWLYAFMRYSTIALNTMVFNPAASMMSCKAGIYATNVLILMQNLCITLFSVLRVYALSDGSYIIVGLVFLLNLVPFIIDTFDYVTVRVVVDLGVCTDSQSIPVSLSITLSLVSRLSLIVGDMLVLVVTWIRTAQSYSHSRRHNMKAPLARVLMYDGTIYFIAILAANVLQVVGSNFTILSIMAPLYQVIPPIAVCRFILNLRQVKPAGDSTISDNQSHSLRFVGNMGESLQFGDIEEEDDELKGDEHTSDTLSRLATEADNSSEASKSEGQSGNGHVNLDVQ